MTVNNALPGTDLQSTVDVVLRAGIPGERSTSRAQVDLLTSVGWPPPPLATQHDRSGYAAALAWALGRSGRSQQALAIAERYAMPLMAAGAANGSPLAQSRGYSLLAETYLLHGHLPEAAASGMYAADYAGTDERHRFRALSLQAASRALNGEFQEAAGVIGSAHDLDQGHGWSAASWPLALAVAQVSFRSGQIQAAAEAIESLALVSTDPIDKIVVRLGNTWMHAARGNYKAAVSEAELVSRTLDAAQVPPFLRDLAISIQALCLSHLGQPAATLDLVGHRASPDGHPVCFEVQAAGAHLQLGDPRRALAVTATCVRHCPNHSLRTFPSVLVRRAVAHELLGHRQLADADFSRATRLGIELGAARPTIGLPIDVLRRLYERLMNNEPDLRDTLLRLIPPDKAYSTPEPLEVDFGTLTPRERVLAQWLTSDLSFNAIAARLNVSPNTVKTQTRSLYRKLGVSGREEARVRLERAGLTAARRPSQA